MINLDDYSVVPHDRGIIIMKDGELQFMAMPEMIMRVFQENDSLSEYLAVFDRVNKVENF